MWYLIITTLELSKYVALCGNSTSIVRDRQREEEKLSKKRDRQTDRQTDKEKQKDSVYLNWLVR